MKLGDLLIAARLATPEQIAEALAAQVGTGKRLGEVLTARGVVSHEALESFLHRVPTEPDSLAATGIEDKVLLSLMIKLIYLGQLENVTQIANVIKLPQHSVAELVMTAVSRRLLRTLGERDKALAYALTDEGTRWAQEALQQSQYAGPAPVSLESFNDMVRRQSINNVIVSFEMIRQAFGELTISDSFIEQIGPALNAGRSMLLYGPPGNGKTSIAHSFAQLFGDLIYVPHAVLIGGQIMRVYDPSIHRDAELPPRVSADSGSILRVEETDARWVPCRRPFVVAGGELSLDMLDMQYNAGANFYEAPLHVKALGGCFVIDDFGRQLVSPISLLNRWIVPMESRVDYMKLHTGKSFSIPFEALLIFSTNLEPEDLMDPAFLRRLPYKLEVGTPSQGAYRRIFDKVCAHQQLPLSDAIFNFIVHKITTEKGLELAAYQPQFIVDQLVSTCRFLGQPPHFESRFIEYAIDNLRVRHH